MDTEHSCFLIIKAFQCKVNVETKNRRTGDRRKNGGFQTKASCRQKHFHKTEKASRLSKTPKAGSLFVIKKGREIICFLCRALISSGHT